MTIARSIQFNISRKAAEDVGRIVVQRAKRLQLDHTPLQLLPIAGKKLLSASRRIRDDLESITVYSINKAEATALFHFLALFFHPENEFKNLLTESETKKVREVVLSIAAQLLAKPGINRQSRSDDEHMIGLYSQDKDGTLPAHRIPPDRAHARRLQSRVRNLTLLEAKKLSSIPIYLQALTSKISR
jgi:hypothetical protein